MKGTDVVKVALFMCFAFILAYRELSGIQLTAQSLHVVDSDVFSGSGKQCVKTGKTALVIHRPARQIHRTRLYWKWYVEAEDLDVFVFSSKTVVEEDGRSFEVDEDFFRDIFGHRLKICIILENHNDIVIELWDQMARYIEILPQDSKMSSNFEENIMSIAGLGILWRYMNSCGALSSYENFFITSTDSVLLYNQDNKLDSKGDETLSKQLFAQFRQPCSIKNKTNDLGESVSLKSLSFQQLSSVKKLRQTLSLFPHDTRVTGFSLPFQHSFFLDKEAFTIISRLWHVMFIPRLASDDNSLSIESQAFIHRITRTNVLELSEVGNNFLQVHLTPISCHIFSGGQSLYMIRQEIITKLEEHQLKREDLLSRLGHEIRVFSREFLFGEKQ